MKLKLTILLGLVFNIALSQISADKNYITVKTYIKAVNEAAADNSADYTQTVNYLDGNGKTVQNILVSVGAGTEDIIFGNEYDQLGRQKKNYLPYARTGNHAAYNPTFTTQQSSFYNTAKYENTLNPYTENVFDELNVQNPNQVAHPGNDWKLLPGTTAKSVKIENTEVYDPAVDMVRKYNINFDVQNRPVLAYNGGYYPQVYLLKHIVKNGNWVTADVNNNTKITFTDQYNRVVLERNFENGTAQDTYYIYDVQGNLTFVLSPKTLHSDLFDGSNNPEVTMPATLNNLCFQYIYDYKNRLIEKKVPGKGWQYIVYDKLSRPLFSQSANQRLTNEWSFVEYDIKGRMACQGTFIDGAAATRQTMQGYANGYSTYVISNPTPDLYFTHYITGYTLVPNVLLYYDNYEFNLDGIVIPTTNSYGEAISTNTNGLPTGTRSRVLGTSNWNTTVNFYNRDDRIIYIATKSQYLVTSNTVEMKLDFLGRLLESKTVHNKTGTTSNLVTFDYYAYDKPGRLLKHTQNIGTKAIEVIDFNKYDELGKLTEKKVGGTTRTILSGISDVNGLLTKTSGTVSWTNATALTTTGITKTGRLFFKSTANLNSYYAAGLTASPSTAAYNQMNYSFQLTNIASGGGKSGYVVENGTTKASFVYFALDTFEIERNGASIVYKINGTVIYTSAVSVLGTLYGDLHLNSAGTTLTNFSVDNYAYAEIAALQTINYKYNIRGWLTQINDPATLGTDLFAQEIRRNNPTGTGTALYNGNISQIFWKTANDSQLRNYSYTYDKMDRLKKAKLYNGSNSLENDSYNIDNISYDKNGNITFLQRYGDKLTDPSYTTKDVINYTYSGNRLTKTEDTGNAALGFNDTLTDDPLNPGNDVTHYLYDADGNLTKDNNKDIASITYNYLNLPVKITFNGSLKSIEYTYDALGIKLAKVVTNGSNVTTTQYNGSYVYQKVNTAPIALQYLAHPQGYIANTSGIFKYVYQYSDYEGNIRMSYTDANNNGSIATTEIIQELNYDPFGMRHTGYNSVYNNLGSETNKTNFVGQELQEDFALNWLQFAARNYDPALGRFLNIDAMAEKYPKISPFAYALNNPVFYVDYDGKEPTPYEAALMARYAYYWNGPLAGGWALSSLDAFDRNEKSGLKGMMFERKKDDGTKEYAYAYAGTDSGRPSWKDWLNNILQVLGLSAQYEQTVDLSRDMDRRLGDIELTFIGHSLGGGLAQMASLVTGRSSYVFNSAWISKVSMKKYQRFFKPLPDSRDRINFTNEYDPLTNLQEDHGESLLEEVSARIEYSQDFLEQWDYLTNHGIEELIEEMIEDGDAYEHNTKEDRDEDDWETVSRNPRYF